MTDPRTTDGRVYVAMSASVYDEVEERFPVAKAKKTHTYPDGRVVNMDREAMLARVHGVCDGICDIVTGRN